MKPSGPARRPRRVPASTTAMHHASPTADALDRIPLAALILANLAPLFGVLFFKWDAGYLLMLYWLENLVIGGWTLLRMLSTGGLRVVPQSVFFTFHYSFFCAGHGAFLLTLVAADAPGLDGDYDEGPGGVFLMPVHMLTAQFDWIAQAMPGLLGLPLLAFIVSHGVSTVYHHFIAGEDRQRDADDIMFDPYKRIVALHIALILGAMLMFNTGLEDTLPALLVLVAAKIAIDVHQHREAHRKRRAATRSEATKENGAEGGAAGNGD